MKVSDAPMKELWLGRKVKFPTGRMGVICSLTLEIPPCRLEDSTLRQLGPRFSEIGFYVIETRRLMHNNFIELMGLVELLDETLDTKDLYELYRS